MGSRLAALYLLVLAAVLHNGASQKDVKPVHDKPKVYSLHVKTDIKYRYAITLITSRVVNPANVSQEVKFHVVLPETAFISGFVMTINEKDYPAYVKEKEEAQKDYNLAVSQGLAAAHIAHSARDSNEFDVAVNIEPLNKVSFELIYEEFLERKLSAYKNEINISPGQIVPELSVEVHITDATPIINLKVPDLRMSNEIMETEPDNPYAVIEKKSPENVTIKWSLNEEQQKKLDEDGVKGQFVVKYDVDRSESPQLILVDEGYFVHFYSDDTLKPLNKHVVFVLDLSGSMHGRKLQQVKDAMNQILSDLKPKDYFSLVLFSDSSKAWAPNEKFELGFHFSREPEQELTVQHVVPATTENIEIAKSFINGLDDLGGTNIIAGLRKGEKLAKIGKDLLKNEGLEPLIIFLTDGQPNVEMSDPEEITKTATELNTLRSPIFSLGFGNGADLDFLRKLSLANSGFARNIYEASDAALQLKLFYYEVASPLLANVTFQYVPGQVGNDTTKVHFDTLFSGGELVVAGKLENPESLNGLVLAHSASGEKEISIKEIKPVIITDCIIPIIPTPKNRTFGHLEKMWAYKTIKQLLDKNIVSKDPGLKKQATDLALKYSFVTPVTSLVVVKPNETTSVNAEKSQVDRFDFAGAYGYAAHGISAGSFGTASGAYGYAVPTSNTAGSFGPPSGAGTPFNTFQPLAFSNLAMMPMGAHLMSSRPVQLFESAFSAPPRPTTTTNWSAALMRAGAAFQRPPPVTFRTIPTSKKDIIANGMVSRKINYTEVTWLNASASDIGMIPFPNQNVTTDVILVDADEDSKGDCVVKGEHGTCKHFVHCILDAFKDDISQFISSYKCHIDPNFLGVCCPSSTII